MCSCISVNAHLVDRNRAEHGHHIAGSRRRSALVLLARRRRDRSWSAAPHRRRGTGGNSARSRSRMIVPVTIGVRKGDMCARIRPLPMTATVNAPSTVPMMRAAATEQAGAAEHDGGDDFELEALSGIGRAGAETGGEDDPAACRRQCRKGHRRRASVSRVSTPARRTASALAPMPVT